MDRRSVVPLLVCCACSPLEAPSDSSAVPVSAWIHAEQVRVDLCGPRRRVTLEGRVLEVDDDLNLRIDGDVAITVSGETPLSAAADSVAVTADHLTLEGGVVTRLAPSGSP